MNEYDCKSTKYCGTCPTVVMGGVMGAGITKDYMRIIFSVGGLLFIRALLLSGCWLHGLVGAVTHDARALTARGGGTECCRSLPAVGVATEQLMRRQAARAASSSGGGTAASGRPSLPPLALLLLLLPPLLLLSRTAAPGSAPSTFYDTLGVSRHASPQEIRVRSRPQLGHHACTEPPAR